MKTRAKDNKGGRTDTDRVPATTLEHLRKIVSFSKLVFDWPNHERTLYIEFHAIQAKAGVQLECSNADEHECTDACHRYGFHSLRRAYATLNVDMGLPVLQKKMRHQSDSTTQRYIELRDKVNAAADTVYVPSFLEQRRVGG